jgi:GGDEF domain-containing protein
MADGTEIRVTCSVGLALHPRDGRSSRALLRAADAQMYERKRARTGTPGDGRPTMAPPDRRAVPAAARAPDVVVVTGGASRA